MIPGSVTNIGWSAFDECGALTSITMPGSPIRIGQDAFFDCRSLTSLTIAKGVTSIGDDEFENWGATLTNITIPGSVTNIGESAFAWCMSLTSVAIPSSVTSIGDGAFANCTSLTSVYFNGNAPTASPDAFSGDNYLDVYYLLGTTGWGPFLADRPTQLWNPQPAAVGVRTGQFGFTINGTVGLVVVVEACTNLANPTWYPLQTNTLTGASFYLSDLQWTNYPARFYRIRSP